MRSRSSFVAVLALAAVGTLGCPSPSTATGAGRPVAGAEAHRLVAAGAVLVDVRSPDEFAAGHNDGARNIPVDELSSRLGELPRDHPVIVYCHSGHRSHQAAGILGAAGYDVRDLGAMDAWNR